MTSARSRDDGSVLMLVPAAVLVLLILGAIAVDSAVVFLAERDLSNRTAAAANDIAGSAADEASFYRGGGEIRLDPPTADAYAARVFSEARRPQGYDDWRGAASVAGRQVTVTAEATVRLVFAPAIPGVSRTTTVQARSVATARGG
ncbi:MAG TPA: hypothetical protein VHN98_03435 [Acidimicrobiales bacterium]|nr:hypothetical protein [Acidimicrobiales bacterium]